MSDFKWGILGAGKIAHAFSSDLKNLPNHRVGAVGSRTLENAQRFAAAFNCENAYGSYEELVNDSSIDAIYVATPHPMHKDNVILALNAGKPVLCEKPFAVNASEAKEMIDAAGKNNVALMEAMWARFLPHYAKIRDIIASGVLGEITTIHADHGQSLADKGIARLVEPDLAGGALLDLGIYPISLAHMVLGKPSKILATTTLTQAGVDAQTSMVFTYHNGSQAILTTTMLAKTPCTAVIAGLNGYLQIDQTFYNPTSMRLVLNDGSIQEFARDYQGHGLREQALEFERVVRNNQCESPILTWKDTLEIMQCMDDVRALINLKYPFEN